MPLRQVGAEWGCLQGKAVNSRAVDVAAAVLQCGRLLAVAASHWGAHTDMGHSKWGAQLLLVHRVSWGAG